MSISISIAASSVRFASRRARRNKVNKCSDHTPRRPNGKIIIISLSRRLAGWRRARGCFRCRTVCQQPCQSPAHTQIYTNTQHSVNKGELPSYMRVRVTYVRVYIARVSGVLRTLNLSRLAERSARSASSSAPLPRPVRLQVSGSLLCSGKSCKPLHNIQFVSTYVGQ